jgi:hypothetical protein
MDKKLVDAVSAAMPKFPETIEDSYILSRAHVDAINKAQSELGPEPDFHPQDGGNQPNPEWVKWFMVKNLCTEEQAIHIGCGKIDFEGDEISLQMVGNGTLKQIPSIGNPYTVTKECSIEQARKQGFTGTPERWEEIKSKYAQDLVRSQGFGVKVDFTNILLGSRDMQDGDGDWHHFPE